MSPFLTFVGLGSLAALLCEVSFKVLATSDYTALPFVFVFYPFYVAAIYWIEKKLPAKSPPTLFIVSYLLFGVIGLSLEWLMGNSPWVHPEASQIGMWA